jgi:hypothetical protein
MTATDTVGTFTHTRDEHSSIDTLALNTAQRIATRETCPVCRVIFTASGDFRGDVWSQRSERNVQRSATIARVTGRADYSAPATAATAARVANSAPSRTPKLANEAQLSYLKSLVAKRETGAVQDQLDVARSLWKLGQLTSAKASLMIDLLKAQPWKAQTATQSPQVAEGRYALRNVPGYDNTVAFFHVSRPTEGKWTGRTFVDQYRSDEELPVRGEGARKVLELIAADPKAAMILFGQETETCGHCGRRLTDDDSRAKGIGPVCGAKLGW